LNSVCYTDIITSLVQMVQSIAGPHRQTACCVLVGHNRVGLYVATRLAQAAAAALSSSL